MKYIVEIIASFGFFLLAAPIAAGARVKLQYEDPCLVEAVDQGDVNKVKMLIRVLGDKAQIGAVRALDEGNSFTLLHRAVKADDKEMAELILSQKGVDPSEGNYFGNIPLHEASSTHMVNLLVEHGAQQLEIKGQGGHTPLAMAAIKGVYKVLNALLDKGANFHVVNENNQSILKIILIEECFTTLNTFLQHPRVSNDTTILPLLHWLAYKGTIAEIITSELFVADVNEKDMHTMTPLHWAALGANLQVAEYLLGNGAKPSIDIEDEWDRTPLYYATAQNNNNMINLLCTHGASQQFNIKKSPITSRLHVAARDGNTELVRRLCRSREKPAGTSESRELTPLHLAVHKGHEEVVRVLLNAGECVDSCQEDALTPLHYAEHPGMIRLLLSSGANINHQNKAGKTALHIAVDNFSVEIVRQLLGNGETDCDLEIADNSGETPLSKAIQHLEKLHTEQTRFKSFCRHSSIIIVRSPEIKSKKVSSLEAIAHLLVSRGADMRQLPQLIGTLFHQNIARRLYLQLQAGPYMERLLALQGYFYMLEEEGTISRDTSAIIVGMLHTPKEVKTILY